MASFPESNDTSSPPAAQKLLRALSEDAIQALEAVAVPAYIVDHHRRVQWQNRAAIEVFGDLRGRLDGSVGLDADDLQQARDAFARKLNGDGHAELEVSVARADGTRVRVAISTVPVKDGDGQMIGSFGLIHV